MLRKTFPPLLVLILAGLCLGASCQREAAQTQQESKPVTLDERCRLKPDPGMCKARMERYYYDQEKQACQVFYWGGCKGTVPFETLADCQAACAGNE